MLRHIVKLQVAVHQKLSSDRGATAVEYGLMVALIAAVIIVAVALLGNNIKALFTDVAGDIAVPAAPVVP